MKTIYLDDEAYEVLSRLKCGPTDSFSRVVKRHFRLQDTLDTTRGAWRDKDPDIADKVREQTRRSFDWSQRDQA